MRLQFPEDVRLVALTYMDLEVYKKKGVTPNNMLATTGRY